MGVFGKMHSTSDAYSSEFWWRVLSVACFHPFPHVCPGHMMHESGEDHEIGIFWIYRPLGHHPDEENKTGLDRGDWSFFPSSLRILKLRMPGNAQETKFGLQCGRRMTCQHGRTRFCTLLQAARLLERFIVCS